MSDKTQELTAPAPRVQEASFEIRLDHKAIKAKLLDIRNLMPAMDGPMAEICEYIGSRLNYDIVAEGFPMTVTLALCDLEMGYEDCNPKGKRISLRVAGNHPRIYEVFRIVVLPRVIDVVFEPETAIIIKAFFRDVDADIAKDAAESAP